MSAIREALARLQRGGYNKKSVAILISQVLNSGGNAIFMLVASFKADEAAFNDYALVQFAGTTLVTLSAAAFWRPAMATRREGQSIASPRQVVAIGALGLLVAMVLLFLALRPGVSWRDYALVVLMLVVPLTHAALRLRAIIDDRTTLAITADGLWLAVSTGLVLVTQDPSLLVLTVMWVIGALVGSVVLLFGYRPSASVVPLSDAFAEGRYLLAATAIGLGANWLSLIVVVRLFPETAVGDYRLAVTLLGPVLVIAATQDTNFMDQADRLRSGWSTDRMQASLRKHAMLAASLGLGYLLVGYIPIAVAAVVGGATPWFFVVGFVAGIARSWNSPYSAALRVLLMARAFLATRIWQTLIALALAGVALVVWRNGDVGLAVYLLATDLVATVSYVVVFKRISSRNESQNISDQSH